MWYNYIVEYYSAVKKMKPQNFWLNRGNWKKYIE